ncbi:MAG: penicillin-binding protein 1C [Gammaproteobacteria bacterium]|nr:penicillin-binding protein 1C [Gammaproteobacteria bacterium]
MKITFKRVSLTLLLLLVSVWMLIYFLPKPSLLESESFSTAVYDEHHQLLRLTLSRDDKYRLYTPLNKMAPNLIAATLLQEDQYFRSHFGVNPVAILKAVRLTYLHHGRRFGASTITMQLARIRFGLHSKTFLGKCTQILRALQLEAHYSKDQILEAYLNLAPYGNNIEGVGAASIIYFGKPADKLNLPEALTLSVIPQNPNQRIPSQKNLREIRNKLFTRWIALHPTDRNQTALVQLPLQMLSAHNLPFLAPHFVDAILKNSSHTTQLTTTLDLRLQKIIERVMQNYLARKKAIGVHNAAILLVDTRDMGVKALIGSANFFDSVIGGQINGAEIKRSPGSTLKPFIYGLALDQGLIHPNTVLKDVPHSFGSYNPENFDYDFMGPIKAKDALVLSRNIPAIYLADALSKPNLYQLLEEAHVTNLKPASYYGLALALGGAEMSMQELTSLYAMLANDGMWHPLRLLQNQSMSSGKRLLSQEASFLVLDMLKNTPRMEPSYLLTRNQQLPVAWKTGTSSGYRDAWTVGVFGPYVLTVWIGNFDNTSNAAFVGRTIAAPLLFDIIDAINTQTGPLPIVVKHPEQMHLEQVSVCRASGMLPTRYCHDTELTWFIPGKSPIKTDTIYREIPIDKKTGLRTCHSDKNTRFEIYEFWSSDLLKIFKQAGIQRRIPPLLNSSCVNAQNNNGIDPQITSPQTELSYVVRSDTTYNNPIVFSATADADVESLYWFVNETYVAKTQRDQPFLWHAKPGSFIVRVADDHGRSDARELVVRVD